MRIPTPAIRTPWVKLSGESTATYTRGGETKIDGDWQDNKQESTLAGASMGFMLTPQFGLCLLAAVPVASADALMITWPGGWEVQAVPPAPVAAPEQKTGFFARLKQGLSMTSASIGEGMASLFLGKKTNK